MTSRWKETVAPLPKAKLSRPMPKSRSLSAVADDASRLADECVVAAACAAGNEIADNMPTNRLKLFGYLAGLIASN